MSDVCAKCGAPIRKINYALGPQWMHVNPSAGFPTVHKGSAWRYCKTAVATPAEEGGR